jgi:hypothetical protein
LHGNSKSVSSYFHAASGNPAKVDVYDLHLSRAQQQRISRSVRDRPVLAALPGRPPSLLKTKSKAIQKQDKQLREIQKVAVTTMEVTNVVAERLAENDREAVARETAKARLLQAGLLTAANDARQALQLDRNTVNALAEDDDEPLIRDEQRKRLHERAEQTEQARSLAQETRVFRAGGGEAGVAAPLLPGATTDILVAAAALVGAVSRGLAAVADASAEAAAEADSATEAAGGPEMAKGTASESSSSSSSKLSLSFLEAFRDTPNTESVIEISSPSSYATTTSISRSSSSSFVVPHSSLHAWDGRTALARSERSGARGELDRRQTRSVRGQMGHDWQRSLGTRRPASPLEICAADGRTDSERSDASSSDASAF